MQNDIYVLLDKTFCAKKCVRYLLFITLLCFLQPSFAAFSAAAISSYMITFYYYCCRASLHNF